MKNIITGTVASWYCPWQPAADPWKQNYRIQYIRGYRTATAEPLRKLNKALPRQHRAASFRTGRAGPNSMTISTPRAGKVPFPPRPFWSLKLVEGRLRQQITHGHTTPADLSETPGASRSPYGNHRHHLCRNLRVSRSSDKAKIWTCRS